MTATFLLVRHAPHTDYNQRLSGRRPGVPLTQGGRLLAEQLGRRLRDAGIDRVQCSPLERTRTTADIIAQSCALSPVVEVDALIELDFGTWTGRPFDSFGEDPEWLAWNRDRAGARIPGGETMNEAQERITGHLATTAQAHPGETILIVTHADLIKAAVAHVLGLSLNHMDRFDIDPGSLTRVVQGYWGARLLALNERVSP